MTREGKELNREIQGLRAVAVGLVVLYHAKLPGLPGGYIGVDIFFVISGYLITLLLMKEFDKSQSIDLLSFYSRRARRLLPAAGVVLAVTVLLAWHIYSPLEFKQFSSSAIATSVYASNLWFSALSTDYLADTAEVNPLLHTWSLAVEEQFYLFWPVIFILLFRDFSNHKNPTRTALLLLAGIVISLAGCVLLTESRQPWAFFNFPSRAWEFGAGTLLAFWISSGSSVTRKWVTPLQWLGFALILYTSTHFNHKTSFPGISALLPVLGTVLLILVASSPSYSNRSIISRFLSTGPMQFFGNISYSLYLWHWPVLVFLPLLLPANATESAVYGVILSVLLGWLTYQLIENPIRFNNFLKKSPANSLGLIGGSSFCILLIIIGARQVSIEHLNSPEQKIYQIARQDIPRIYADKCHLEFFTTEPTLCTYGQPSAGKTVVLFGDSHAAQWFPAFEKIALERDYRLLPMTKSACPSVNIDVYNPSLGRQYEECTEWRTKAFDRIEEIDPDLIVISNSVWYSDTSNPEDMIRWIEALQGTIARLSKLRGKIVLIRDIPKASFDPPTCLARAAWKGSSLTECTFPATHAYESKLYVRTQEIIKSFGKAKLLDMTPYICSDNPCRTERSGIVIYRDSNHITGAFSRSLAKTITTALSL